MSSIPEHNRPRTKAIASDPENARTGVEVAVLTDLGRQRPNNEDSSLYWEPESGEEFARKGRLAIVADGMGGYEGGQEASRLAVETVAEIYRSSESDPQRSLLDGFAAAHQEIQRYGTENPEFQGMGTTCTALSIVGRQLHFAHVGDSRLYLQRTGTISRLTRDHSYVSRLVESGIVRSEDAESHPQRHILTAALGSGRDIVPDAPERSVSLEDGDQLLLCTDGLWSLVADHELSAVLNANRPVESCGILVQMALDRGGPDNITVVVLRISA